jgi:ATP-binding cassette subfamily B protein
MAKKIPLQQLKLLWHFMQGSRVLYFGAILAVGLATIFGLITPLILRTTIDSIIGDKPMIHMFSWLHSIIESIGGKDVLMQNLWICSLTIIVLAIAEGLFMYLKGKWSALAAETTAQHIRDKLYNHLQHLSYEYHVKAETGDLIQRCTSDVDTIRQFLAVQFVEVGRTLFMVAIVVPLMLSLDRRMTLVAMLLIPIIFIFAFGFFFKVKKVFLASDEAEGRMSTVLQENLSGVRVIRAFARQSYEIEKFDEANREYRDRTYRLIRLIAGYWAVSSSLGVLQFGFVLTFGAYLAYQGQLSLGTLVVFTSYVDRLIWPIRQMGRILTDMGKALVALKRIREILEQPLESSEAASAKPHIRGNLEFRNVSFEYEPGKPVLKDISFRVKQGQTVAILGPTGSGKTSLVHLLTRLYDYQHGSITIDGVELKSIEKKWLREHVGLVLQEPFLFSKTIKQNIGLAKKNVQDQKIFEAARIASVHDVILDFDDGYETAVGEKGVTLSGGQKQRVAIARTLVKECPIIIFDDSLSAVDTETDAAIRHALRHRNHATTFMISHRVNTLSEAELILVLEHGKLVQAGTHDELVQQEGLYRKIWAIQNSLEDELEDELEPTLPQKMMTA